MTPRIFTVSANPVLDRTMIVPELRHNEVLYSTATHLDAGGKGFNVSRALRALGMESHSYAFVGGSTGQMLERMLEQQGIPTHFVYVQGETRTNVVITDEHGREHVKANEPGPIVTSDDVNHLVQMLETDLLPGDICVLTGSLPRGAPEDFYATLIRLVHARGGRAVLDTSREWLKHGLGARPWIVKPNGLETSQLLGYPVTTPSEAQNAISILRARGAVIAGISLGADGIVAGNGAELLWAKPPHLQALNTVGAGDALMAGIVWSLALGRSFADAVRWGVACGTTASMLPDIAFGNAADVGEMVQRVELMSL